MFPSARSPPLTPPNRGVRGRQNQRRRPSSFISLASSTSAAPVRCRGDRAPPSRPGQLSGRRAAQLRLPPALRDAAQDNECRQERTSEGEMSGAQRFAHIHPQPAAPPQDAPQRVRFIHNSLCFTLSALDQDKIDLHPFEPTG